MEWLTEVQLPGVTLDSSSSSTTVILIVTLGGVVVALIGLASTWVNSRPRVTGQPAAPVDPELPIKVAVLADHDQQNTRTLAQLDRHVDGIGDQVDKHEWRLDDLQGRVDELFRRQGLR